MGDLRMQEYQEFRKQFHNSERLKKLIVSSAARGLLLSTDLEKVHLLVQTKEELAVYQGLVFRYIQLNQGNKLVKHSAVSHMHRFYQLAHLMVTPDLAMKMFEDWLSLVGKEPVGGSLETHSHLLLTNLLAQHGRWEEILQVYQSLDISSLHQASRYSLLTLALMALVKLDHTDAYQVGTRLVNESLQIEQMQVEQLVGQTGFGRATQLLAWMAHKAGEHTTAYEMVRAMKEGKTKILNNNLEIFLLLQIGRVADAVEVLKTMVDVEDSPVWDRNGRPQLCKEVIQLLVQQVNSQEGEDIREVKDNLRTIFISLDNTAEMIEKTVEDLLFDPIDFAKKSKKKMITEKESIESKFRPRKKT